MDSTTDLTQRRVFKDIYGFGVPYIYVHPYKQKAVKHLVENLQSWVTHVIVFGSAVKSGHFWWSDIDVCLIGEPPNDNYTQGLKIRNSNHSYDFVLYSSLYELERDAISYANLGYHIIREGVVVYESELSDPAPET